MVPLPRYVRAVPKPNGRVFYYFHKGRNTPAAWPPVRLPNEPLSEEWRKFFAMLTGLRVEAGFDPIPSELEDLWMLQDKMIATTLASLDQAPGELKQAYKLRHVGPVLERERHGVRVELPWSDDTPIVLVSFSTAPEQGSVQKFQMRSMHLLHSRCTVW